MVEAQEDGVGNLNEAIAAITAIGTASGDERYALLTQAMDALEREYMRWEDDGGSSR